ncbi:hypothetical protein [Kocuria sp. SL71]|uniref:hypothetical protein n=1 Tax=Kocuria sp. SL71 TaxID=2995151 RepID=UPI0022744085|nr:hypothetical protein [Kocuria sp. SL71]MCY1684172.1 hypothetical protein [Kocuria sp. SL71]
MPGWGAPIEDAPHDAPPTAPPAPDTAVKGVGAGGPAPDRSQHDPRSQAGLDAWTQISGGRRGLSWWGQAEDLRRRLPEEPRPGRRQQVRQRRAHALLGEEKQGELWFLTLFVRLAALAAMNAMVMGEIGTGILTGLGVGQELEVQPRGTFKPSGGWVKAGSVKRRARKPATARVGDVAVDSTSPSAGSSTNAAGTSTATKSADEDSAEVATLARRAADRQAHLPAPVRASVLRRAQRTDHYYGSAWRTGGREPGSLPRYVSQILRMNECEAVVISASRIGEDPQWPSAQYTYDLRTEVPDRGPALGRGGRQAPGAGSSDIAAGRLGR